MLAKIQRWGNSQGLRLTKNLLGDAQQRFEEKYEEFLLRELEVLNTKKTSKSTLSEDQVSIEES